MYNRVTLGALYLLYVVPCALKNALVLQGPVPFLIIPIILLTSPFIAFFSDRTGIIAELEDVIGGPIKRNEEVQEVQEQQPQQEWLREKPSLMRAWIAPME